MATDSKDFKVKNGLIVAEGGTFGGTVTVAAPTSNTHAATKLYVDNLLASGGSGSITVSDTPPSSPSEGDLWYNSTDGSTYVYYDSFWVESTSAYAGPTGMVAASAPLSFDEATSTLTIDLSSYYTSAETDAAIAVAVAGLVDSAPATLDTLNELSAALGDDENFATTVTNSLAAKIDSTEKGANDGVATLDSSGQVPANQLGNATVDLSSYDTIAKNIETISPVATAYTVGSAVANSEIIVSSSMQNDVAVTLPTETGSPIGLGESVVISNLSTTKSAILTPQSGSTGWQMGGVMAPGDVLGLTYDTDNNTLIALEYSGSSARTYYSQDGGSNWIQGAAISGLNTNTNQKWAGSIFKAPGGIYAYGIDTLAVSVNGYSNWSTISPPATGDIYYFSYIPQLSLFFVKQGGAWYSSSDLINWSAPGAQSFSWPLSKLIYVDAPGTPFNGYLMFSNTESFVFYSSDNGLTWNAFSDSFGYATYAAGNGIVVKRYDGNVRVYHPDGTNTLVSNLITKPTTMYGGLEYVNGKFYLASYGDQEILSSSDGITWSRESATFGTDDLLYYISDGANTIYSPAYSPSNLWSSSLALSSWSPASITKVLPQQSAKITRVAANSYSIIFGQSEDQTAINESNTISSIMGVY